MIISRTEPSLFQRSSLRFTTPSLGSIFSKTQRRSIKFHSRWSKLRLILTWEQRQASCTHVIRRLHLRQTLPVTNHTLSFSRSFAIRSSLSLSLPLSFVISRAHTVTVRLSAFPEIFRGVGMEYEVAARTCKCIANCRCEVLNAGGERWWPSRWRRRTRTRRIGARRRSYSRRETSHFDVPAHAGIRGWRHGRRETRHLGEEDDD